MKILGIIGSSRKKGNTATLVRMALDGAQKLGAETEIVYLSDYDFKGCTGCEGCRDRTTCIVKDDMQLLYPKLFEADALVLGSPTYYYNVSAMVKAFIERCYCLNFFDSEDRSLWTSVNEVLGIKYAVVVAVCEQHKAEDMGVTAEVMQRSLEAFGYRVIETVKTLRAFKAGDVESDQRSMLEARKAGEKLVRQLRLREDVRGKIDGQ